MAGTARTRAWLTAAVALVALVAVLVVAVPGGDRARQAAPPPSPSTTPSAATAAAKAASTEQIRELLNRRAQAVLHRDEEAFLDGIDPRADPRFVRSQRELFANLARVPLAEWRYRLDPAAPADLSRVSGRGDAGGARLWAPRVSLEYALAGVDKTPTSRPMGYLFVHRAGRWYLRSDTALRSSGRETWRGPWDFGPCVAFPTGSGLVLAHPSRTETARRLAAELDPAVRAVTDVWGDGWSRRVALWLPDTAEEMRALVGPKFRIEGIVAAAVADRVDRPSHSAWGQRVVVSPGGAEQLSDESLRVVLRHEITHIAARGDTVDGAPMWLLEGFADYVGYRETDVPMAHAAPVLAASVRTHGLPNALPSDQDFAAGGAALDLAYQRSWSLSRYIAEGFGEPKLLEFYRRIAGIGPVGKSTMDAVLREVLGIDRGGLLRGWREYLRHGFG
ncbi:MAG: hypothetical protein GEU98_12920 [Pseudonocardiaceae bacterium]|nr:hypothetical protein [Pseudonocardiaceae bacterium]